MEERYFNGNCIFQWKLLTEQSSRCSLDQALLTRATHCVVCVRTCICLSVGVHGEGFFWVSYSEMWMGVKYDWLEERIRGWVHKAIKAGWGGVGVTCETLERQVCMIWSATVCSSLKLMFKCLFVWVQQCLIFRSQVSSLLSDKAGRRLDKTGQHCPLAITVLCPHPCWYQSC